MRLLHNAESELLVSRTLIGLLPAAITAITAITAIVVDAVPLLPVWPLVPPGPAVRR